MFNWFVFRIVIGFGIDKIREVNIMVNILVNYIFWLICIIVVGYRWD